MHPVITIFCAFTRRWAVDGWLENLAAVEHDPAQTNLCIIVDCDEQYIANRCKKFAEERGYRSFYCKVNDQWHPNEVRLTVRRMRVADVHNQSKDLISLTDGEFIIGLEDDTVFDRLTSFARLIEPMLARPTVGYVEGVQMGRWGANIIGAWEADNVHDPKQIKTLLPPKPCICPPGELLPDCDSEIRAELEEITGGGFYGYATRRSLYLNCDYYTSSAQPWGPDVNYGFWLCQRGHTCLVDWQTIFGHRDYTNVLYPDDPKVKLSQIVYNRDEVTGKWMRTDYEPARY